MKQPLEWTRLKSILTKIKRSNSRTIVAAGDDAFVFASFKENTVLSQDMFIEDTHFKTDWSSAYEIGFKAIARNLSDFAAMGATPEFAQVSIALPKESHHQWLEDFYTGALSACDQAQVEIIGGDLSTSKSIFIDVSMCGFVDRPLTRSRAQVGDLILCSGPLGLAHSGLLALKNRLDPQTYSSSIKRQKKGQARLDLFTQLQQYAPLIHACIDTSDDLMSTLYHILSPHQFGATLDLSSPTFIHNECKLLSQELQLDLKNILLFGGEDYELIITIPPDAKSFFSDWIPIGTITSTKGVFLSGDSTPLSYGNAWDPFSTT